MTKVDEFGMTASFCPVDLTDSMTYGPDYPYVSKKCRKKSRDSDIPSGTDAAHGLWNDNMYSDGQFEDSSHFSDYSSCSDLCSSPESSEGFHPNRSSFNTLPNHHDLLSPFSKFVRHGQYDCRKTAAASTTTAQGAPDYLPHKKHHTLHGSSVKKKDGATQVVIDEDHHSGLSTFKVSRRGGVNYHSPRDDQKYFHPIREGNDVGESMGVKDTFKLLTPMSDYLLKSSDFSHITNDNTSSDERTKDSYSKLDVAQSMTDLFSKDTSTTLRSGVASTVAIDNKIEQAMDLVKSHLMYAVREEVEVLKEQIKELIEKNQQLEMENAYLKSNATPDLLKQLQAHVDSSPTPPPVMAPPVASNLPSGTATSFGTGQYPTQTVTSQTGGGGTTGAASSSSSTIAAVNVTHSSSNAAPSSTTGAGAYSSSSPGNP